MPSIRCLVAFFCVLAVHASANAEGLLGRYVIYERADDLFFVGEVLNMNAKPNVSGNSTDRKFIVFVECTNAGSCRVERVRIGEGDNWLPILSWHENEPVILSKDFKSGLTMGTSGRRPIPILELNLNETAFFKWQMSGGEIPESLALLNKEKFGVTKQVIGGGIGFAQQTEIEFQSWVIILGHRKSVMNCSELSLKTLPKQSNSELPVRITVAF